MTKNIYTLINLIVIGAIIFLGIDTFYGFIETRLEPPDVNKISASKKPQTSKGPRRQSLRDYEIINRRSIFGKVIDDVKEPVEDDHEVENLEPTSLKISLVGTVAGDQEISRAIILIKSKRSQDIYRVGDSVENAIIKKILWGKVVLRVNGQDEILIKDELSTQNDSASSRAATPSARRATPQRTITVDREKIIESLTDINKVLTQASIKPHFTDGEPDGLAFTGVRAGSIFRKVGLRNGDIVKSIDGQDIKSPEDLISLYNNLKSEDSVSLDIIRRGRERTNNIKLK